MMLSPWLWFPTSAVADALCAKHVLVLYVVGKYGLLKVYALVGVLDFSYDIASHSSYRRKRPDCQEMTTRLQEKIVQVNCESAKKRRKSSELTILHKTSR